MHRVYLAFAFVGVVAIVYGPRCPDKGTWVDSFMNTVDKFRCPTCDTEYRLVRVEAEPSGNEHPLTCLGCGAPLCNREGKFALKYFRVDGRPVTRGRKSML
jgi:hypothetical protein